MIGLWIAAVLLAAGTVAALLWPLLRRGQDGGAGRADYDLTVYRDQLAEVDRDLDRGVVSPDQAEAARVEIQRRMLAAASETEAKPETKSKPDGPSRGRMPVAVLIGVAVPAMAIGGYMVLGSPGTPDQPLTARQLPPPAEAPVAESESPPAGSMGDVVAQLAERLEARLDDLEGWLLLGRSYLSMGRASEAAEALRRAYALSGNDPAIASTFGEALVAQENGRVSDAARDVFVAALEADTRDPRARYYLALARAQKGDVRGALRGWVDLLALSPPDAPWVATVRQQIDRAAAELGVDPATVAPSEEARTPAVVPSSQSGSAFPGPSREDVEAAAEMTAEERTEMIRGMVQGLADRLAEEPDDLEGWLRLARAYEVLGEAEKARDARQRAEALRNR